jgi:uncharacterized protein with PIN domain
MTEERTEKRFIVDSMLGKLAKWLRILGFDTRYIRLTTKDQLNRFLGEGFLVITRNLKWCNRERVVCPGADEPVEQLREVVSVVHIQREELHLLTRCVRCNQPLNKIPKESAVGLVPDYVLEINADFSQCPECCKIYWRGSHPERMIARLLNVLGWAF